MAQGKIQITMKGEPLTLSGAGVNIGQKALDFEVLDNDLKTVNS